MMLKSEGTVGATPIVTTRGAPYDGNYGLTMAVGKRHRARDTALKVTRLNTPTTTPLQSTLSTLHHRCGTTQRILDELRNKLLHIIYKHQFVESYTIHNIA